MVDHPPGTRQTDGDRERGPVQGPAPGLRGVGTTRSSHEAGPQLAAVPQTRGPCWLTTVRVEVLPSLHATSTRCTGVPSTSSAVVPVTSPVPPGAYSGGTACGASRACSSAQSSP